MKKWYQSKTMWVNIVALAGVAIESATGKQVLDAQTQGVILTVINIILRIVTKEPIAWKDLEAGIPADAFAPEDVPAPAQSASAAPPVEAPAPAPAAPADQPAAAAPAQTPAP